MASAACSRFSNPTTDSSSEGERTQSQDPSKTDGSFFNFDIASVNHQGAIVDWHPGRAEVKREDLGNGMELELVGVPGGRFVMGSPESEEYRWNDEGPQHEVTVPSFWMGKYAVTQAQWRVVASWPQVERELDPEPSFFKGDNRPVELVSWFEAEEFCKRLARKTECEYRLPSEAEWEYVCRAGTENTLSLWRNNNDGAGQTIGGTDREWQGEILLGYYGDGPRGKFREETMEVGSFPPNGFGLYDMHGNVWEWCADWWHDSYAGAPPGGTPWIKGGLEDRRVLRGGSWGNPPQYCRSASRYWGRPVSRYDVIGFRVVCSSARPLR